MLGDAYLNVHHWFKGFNPWKSEIKKTMVWVTLPDLPIEFYNQVAVHRIASKIGKPIRVNRATKEGARGKYARDCVEVDDVGKSNVNLTSKLIRVEVFLRV
ncbi:hypothetical protein LINGRAHAP2_LOCUS30229 [Linum grandiflorum]